jgi:hypothetical protein
MTAAYKRGDCLAICDQCGFRFYLSELRKQWDGALTCKACYEPRHPQDKLKVPPERPPMKNPRPEVTDVFITKVEPEDIT